MANTIRFISLDVDLVSKEDRKKVISFLKEKGYKWGDKDRFKQAKNGIERY
jgi:hypothetical protein